MPFEITSNNGSTPKGGILLQMRNEYREVTHIAYKEGQIGYVKLNVN